MICCSLFAEEFGNLIKKIKEIHKLVDAVELRCDEYVPTISQLEEIRKILFNKVLIITVKNIPLLRSKRFDKIFSWFSKFSNVLFDIDGKYISYFLYRKIPPNNIVVSYHNYESIPCLRRIYEKLNSFNGRYVKIAVKPVNFYDLVELYEFGRKNYLNLILVGMGELGKITRILYRKFGSCLTYTCYDEKNKTAPGQVCLKDLLFIYKVKRINSKTTLYGLLGRDISHSLSYYYYNKNFELLKQNAVFVNFDTENTEGIHQFIKCLDIKGLAITSPYKNSLDYIISDYEERIKKLKIYNTILFKGQRVYAYNTDIDAFIEILSLVRKKKDIEKVLILGSGSMTKVALYVLRNYFRIPRIAILSRSQKREHVNKIVSQNYDVIINCSKFGFLNLADQVYEEVLKLVTCETVCIELNYKEVDTPLVKQAKRKGAVVFTGLDFFRKQFVKQFKLLTSFNPPVG